MQRIYLKMMQLLVFNGVFTISIQALRQLRQMAQEVTQSSVNGWGRRPAALRALSQRLSRQVYLAV